MAIHTQKVKPSSGLETLKHFLDISARYKRDLLLSSLIFLSSILLNTAVPLLTGKALAALTTPHAHPMHYVPLLAITALIGVTANYIGFNAYFQLQPKVMRIIEEESLSALLQRSVGFHNNSIAGKLISDTTAYASSYLILSNSFVINIIPFVLGLSTGIIVVFLNSALLGMLVLCMTVSVISVAIYQTAKMTDNRNQRHTARNAMISHLADNVSNAVTIKTFAREAYELDTHQKLAKPLLGFRARDWKKLAEEGSGRIAVLLFFEIACLTLIIHLVSKNPALLGIGIFTFGYAIGLANKLFDIGSIFRTVEDGLLDASSMMQIINSQPEIQDAFGAKELVVSDGLIDFNAVTFHYSDDSKTAVFKDLSLTITPGQKVGLVGPSGGGKSTLTRLLLRFEDIQGGAIMIDGQPITAVTQSSLRSSIAYVPQEPLMFHRSIRENIAYGNPTASFDDVQAAAKKASALEFVLALPGGFDTIVGERGVKLSGGQRQRIAIARAILKNAPILVLDEATSALDSESEVAIQSALSELMNDRTTLVIAHRLSTIQRLDRIIVLNDGVIVEDGTHANLLSQKGLYARLWKHQSGGFIDD